MTTSLHLVDTQTAELVPGDQGYLDKIQELETQLRKAEKRVRSLDCQIAALEERKAKARLEHAQRRIIEDVFQEWCQVAGRKATTKLGAVRFDTIASRLAEGRSRWEFSLAIYYGVHRPPIKDGIRFDDISLICRDEVRFETRMRACYREFPDVAKGFLPAGEIVQLPGIAS
jgi:hypothetical protein